mgnify:CR=1 FL=1
MRRNDYDAFVNALPRFPKRRKRGPIVAAGAAKPALASAPLNVPKGACVDCLSAPAPFNRARREHVCLGCR